MAGIPQKQLGCLKLTSCFAWYISSMFSSLFLHVTQMQLELQVFPLAKHSQQSFRQSIFVHLQPCCCRDWRGERLSCQIVFMTSSFCCILLRLNAGMELRLKGTSQSSISKRSFLDSGSPPILSRSLKLMNLSEPELEEECLEGNLKLVCIFDYINAIRLLEPKFKNCDLIHTMSTFQQFKFNNVVITYESKQILWEYFFIIFYQYQEPSFYQKLIDWVFATIYKSIQQQHLWDIITKFPTIYFTCFLKTPFPPDPFHAFFIYSHPTATLIISSHIIILLFYFNYFIDIFMPLSRNQKLSNPSPSLSVPFYNLFRSTRTHIFPLHNNPKIHKTITDFQNQELV